VIIGDDTTTNSNYVAINQLSIYTQAFKSNDMHRVFNLGLRTYSNFDTSLLI